MKWNQKLGHPSAEILVMPRKLEYVPVISPQAENSLTRHACLTSKSNQALVWPRNRKANCPLELVHVEILGPMKSSSLHVKRYDLGIMDDYTATSDISFLTKRSETFQHLRAYQVREEIVTGFMLNSIRIGRTGENLADVLTDLWNTEGMKVEYSLPYAPQRNGTSERLMR